MMSALPCTVPILGRRLPYWIPGPLAPKPTGGYIRWPRGAESRRRSPAPVLVLIQLDRRSARESRYEPPRQPTLDLLEYRTELEMRHRIKLPSARVTYHPSGKPKRRCALRLATCLTLHG